MCIIKKSFQIFIALLLIFITVKFALASTLDDFYTPRILEPQTYSTNATLCQGYSYCFLYNYMKTYLHSSNNMKIESKENITFGITKIRFGQLDINVGNILLALSGTRLQTIIYDNFLIQQEMELGRMKEYIQIPNIPLILRGRNIAFFYNVSTTGTMQIVNGELIFYSNGVPFGKFEKIVLNDSVGNSLYLNFSLEGNQLSFLVPANYLSGITYPLTIDPTYDDFTTSQEFTYSASSSGSASGCINSTYSNCTWLITTQSTGGACSGDCNGGSSYVIARPNSRNLSLTSSAVSVLDGSNCEYSNLDYAYFKNNNSIANLSKYPLVKINLNSIRIVTTGIVVTPTGNIYLNYYGSNIYSYSYSGLGKDGFVETAVNISIIKYNSTYWNVTWIGASNNATRLTSLTSLSGSNFMIQTGANSGACSFSPTGLGASYSYIYLNSIEYFDLPPTSSGLSNNASSAKYNETVRFNTTAYDDNELSNYTFSSNVTGSFVNYSTVAFPSGQMSYAINYNLTVNTSYGTVVCGLFYVKDTMNNTNTTPNSCFTVANTIPSINSVTISPSPSQQTDNLTCSFIYYDPDSSVQTFSNETKWYRNGIYNVTNISTINTVNLTVGDIWICEAKVTDQLTYSSPLNSTPLTVGDTTLPIFVNGTATDSTTLTQSVITATVSDLSSSIGSVTAQITQPSGLSFNYTMTFLSGTNAPNLNSTWTLNYSNVAGIYKVQFYFQDSSGNKQNTSFNYINFTISNPVVGDTGGGGGGSAPIRIVTIACVDSFNNTLWKIQTEQSQQSYALLMPTKSAKPREKILILSNYGSQPVTITFKCEEQKEGNNICDNVLFSTDKLTIPPSKITNQNVIVYVQSFNNTQFGETFYFNVVADDNSQCQGRITIQASVSWLGEFFKYTNIPLSSVSKRADIQIPTIFISLTVSFIMAITTFLIVDHLGKNYELMAALISLMVFVGDFAVLQFLLL